MVYWFYLGSRVRPNVMQAGHYKEHEISTLASLSLGLRLSDMLPGNSHIHHKAHTRLLIAKARILGRDLVTSSETSFYAEQLDAQTMPSRLLSNQEHINWCFVLRKRLAIGLGDTGHDY
ncbi:hypothetical protein X797_001929 [Metarhizium robertsii]|uniref:Uncharacterized protein n=1 Tax=Metarhizium robertsii TaxID=568076 RepID=A0A0A1V1U1_9HYPO|nr:hypothetical protein X797_001929 [Metarhizium robertsii]